MLQEIPCKQVTGILNQSLGAGLKQRLNYQAESTLEPDRDQDFVSGTCDIARDPQVTRNSTPQWLVAHDIMQIGIRHLLGIELSSHTRGD